MQVGIISPKRDALRGGRCEERRQGGFSLRPTRLPEVRFIREGLYVPSARTLALADVHLGWEETLHDEGTLVPRGHLRAVLERLEGIVRTLDGRARLERVVVNGDLRHRFGPWTRQAWREAQEFLDCLQAVASEVVLVEGNHDEGSLAALAERREGVLVRKEYGVDGLWFIHGDRAPEAVPEGVEAIVIGHEHPAVGLRDPVTGRVETFKCFLVGRYRGRTLVVQPALNPWTLGSDLLREEPLSPLLAEGVLEGCRVYPLGDDGTVLSFGPFRRLLPGGTGSGVRA